MNPYFVSDHWGKGLKGLAPGSLWAGVSSESDENTGLNGLGSEDFCLGCGLGIVTSGFLAAMA